MKQKTMTFLLFFILSQHVFAQCWREVAAGTYHTLAIRSDGTLWAWGLNDKGQLGDGTTVNKNVPTKIGIAADWATIDVVADNSMALKTDGSLWCWGNNYYGSVGDGNYGVGVINTIPTHIGTDTDWVKISTGARTYAIKSNGTLWGWGDNYYGHLGVGNTNPYYTPTQIGTDTWIDISGGGNQTLAIKTNHTLWGWGLNKLGSLAIGPPSESDIITIPTQTGNNTADWAKISVGGCCSSKMIKTDGSLWAMGTNGEGNIGNGSIVNVNTPTQVGTDTDWNSIATSGHTFGIKNNGMLYGWGANGFAGQLGDGTFIYKAVPTPAGTNTTWLKVQVGLFHTAAIDSGGSLYTWGLNNYGQLGDGTLVNKNVITSIGLSCSLGTTKFSILNEVQIYPNPVTNIGILDYELANNESISIGITNSLGQLMSSEKIIGFIGKNQYTLNTSTYSAGLYLITIKTATESVTVKLIKN